MTLVLGKNRGVFMANKINVMKHLAKKCYNGVEKEENADLKHHGILGMHWGIRRYQPYGMGGYLPKGKEGLSYKNRRDAEKAGKKLRKNNKNGMSQFMSNHDNRFQHAVERECDDGIIRALPDALFAKAYEEGQLKSNPYSLSQDVNNDDGTLSKWALSRVNENFRKEGYGTTNNCMKDTAALIAQQMGFDFMGGKCEDGIEGNAIGYWFDNADPYKSPSNDVDTYLSKAFNPNSFGAIDIHYTKPDDNGEIKRLGGHEIFWKTDNNGKVHYYDGQPDGGQEWSSYLDVCKDNKADVNYDANIWDCTYAKPNWDHLAEDSVVHGQDFHDVTSRYYDRQDGGYYDNYWETRR